MAAEHVGFVRRHYPAAASKTATIKRLCRDLSAGPDPLADRIASLGLEGVSLDRWEDVEDPAGGEDEDYVACAKELHVLCAELLTRLS
jgi:hypothetical protein